jgi:hypothetical protein
LKHALNLCSGANLSPHHIVTFHRNFDIAPHQQQEMKRKSNIYLPLVLALLTLASWGCETNLPYREITYNPEQGFVVKKDGGEPTEVLAGRNLMVDKLGIGTVVIYDTLRCGGQSIADYEDVAEMKYQDFSATAVDAASVLVLDKTSARTWTVDLDQCCIIFRYDASGTMALMADPKCPGLKVP